MEAMAHQAGASGLSFRAEGEESRLVDVLRSLARATRRLGMTKGGAVPGFAMPAMAQQASANSMSFRAEGEESRPIARLSFRAEGEESRLVDVLRSLARATRRLGMTKRGAARGLGMT
jgi:hypothetical protein